MDQQVIKQIESEKFVSIGSPRIWQHNVDGRWHLGVDIFINKAACWHEAGFEAPPLAKLEAWTQQADQAAAEVTCIYKLIQKCAEDYMRTQHCTASGISYPNNRRLIPSEENNALVDRHFSVLEGPNMAHFKALFSNSDIEIPDDFQREWDNIKPLCNQQLAPSVEALEQGLNDYIRAKLKAHHEMITERKGGLLEV